MSVEALVEEIMRLAREEAERILAEAEKKAEQIISEARRKAEQIPAKKLAEIEKRLAERERVALAEARIEGRRLLLKVKSELTEKAFALAEEKLRKFVESGGPEYEEILFKLAVEALMGLGGSEYVIAVNERDRALIEKLLPRIQRVVEKMKGSRVSIRVSEEPAKVMGGVIAYTGDMRQYYNNSVDARLLKFKSEGRGRILDILFGGVR